MFEHSNIIYLRYFRKNLRWSIFGSHIAKRSYSWNPGLMRLSLSRGAGKKEGVTRTFNLTRSMKDNPSKASNTLAAEIWSLFCAKHRVLWPQESSNRWRFKKYLARLISGSSKSFMEKDYMLFVCSLRSLPSSLPVQTAQPHPHCSLCHKEGAGAGSTSSFAVSLTTNNMESSRAGICNHDWLAIQWRLQSEINAQVRDRRLSRTRTELRAAESCAKRLTASHWWTRRLLKWCMTKLGKFSLQVTMVLWTLFRTRLTTIYLFQNQKFAQSCVKSWLCSQASVQRHL